MANNRRIPRSLRTTDIRKIDEDIALTKRELKLLRKVRDALLEHKPIDPLRHSQFCQCRTCQDVKLKKGDLS